ncbi:hypothetical protein B0I35DRAFT_434219 [Stachybotrys elegans]|uniref:AA1-like domain-containing protein n=1 Tax=Stachybotrys elegans TaxID=80388 RepID=A0A8K0SV48_9HYPO|nr:hypothetical protein B0I35DRAFT_434219 [Stachybotrys elegans]
MKYMTFSFAAMSLAFGLATAVPTPQGGGSPTVTWGVTDFDLYSSASTGEASITFRTTAADNLDPNIYYLCSATVPAEADGGVPTMTRLPCDSPGLSFSFNPATEDSTTFPSLLIYTPSQLGVSVFRRDVLVLNNGTERWMGTSSFGISNIFDA